MKMNQFFILVLSVFLLALPACKQSPITVAKDLQEEPVVLAESEKTDKVSRKVRDILKSAQSFADNAQEQYAQEMILFSNMTDAKATSKEELAKEIKIIAITQHKKYLNNWSSVLSLEAELTRYSPLYHYQLECDRNVSKSNSLVKRLKNVSNNLVSQENKNLLEIMIKINSVLTQVQNIIHFDLDFIRDKQVCCSK